MYRQRERLNIQFDELWKWLMMTLKQRYNEVKKTFIHKVQMTEHAFENKVSGQQENQVWDSSKVQETTEKHHTQIDGQHQHKVQDLGRNEQIKYT